MDARREDACTGRGHERAKHAYRRPTIEGRRYRYREKSSPRRRLVAIEDSLTHVFQSDAIHNADVSFSAITTL
jgi:hypothetical protein